MILQMCVIHQMDFELVDQETLLSIRYKFKQYNIILRGSYKGDGYQMFKAKDFQRTSSNYMTQMGIYTLIEKLNGRNPELITQKCLGNIVNQIQTMLKDL